MAYIVAEPALLVGGYAISSTLSDKEAGLAGDKIDNELASATPPAIIHQSRPSYSKEAQKAKITGTVLLGLGVTKDGQPSNIRVIKSLGYGLDEKAIDAVKKLIP